MSISTERDVVIAKRALRARVVAARASLTAGERAQRSAVIASHFMALPEAQTARILMCFVSFGSEVDTTAIIEWALKQEKTVAAPRIIAPRRMVMHRFTDPTRDFEEGKHGIRAPRADLPVVAPAEFDLILMPGSAFSADGGRLGYGGGYYDTYLAHAANTPRIAVAFELQIVDELPHEAHDLAVDAIVTEQRVIRPQGQR